jgi:hypothetical protein
MSYFIYAKVDILKKCFFEFWVMDMQQGYASWSSVAWACSMDMQQRLAAWTNSMVM